MVSSVLRHRRANRLGWAAVAAGAAVVLVGGGVVYSRQDEGGCSGDPVALTIAASPDHAPVMSRLAEQWNAQKPAVDERCVSARVRPMPAEVVAGSLGGWNVGRDGPAPDVWAPDYSAWLQVAASRPDTAPVLPKEVPPSLASTPVVIAMQRPMAESLGWPGKELGWADLVGAFTRGKGWAQFGHPEWGPLRVGIPDPARSTAGLVAVLTVLDPDNNQTMSNQELTGGLLLSQLVTTETADSIALLREYAQGDPAQKAASQPAAFPVLERDLAEHAASKPAAPLVPVYPREGTAYADYPYAVLRAPWVDDVRQRAAADFLAHLRSPAGRQAYETAGFRDAGRVTDNTALLVADRGFKRELAAPFRKITGESLTQLVGMWTVIQRPNNAMVVLDTSGSMNDPVPGTRQTRLQLIRQAAISGVSLLNNKTTIGLWVFSTKLTPTTDYRELVAPGRAGELIGGITRRQAIAGAVQGLRAAAVPACTTRCSPRTSGCSRPGGPTRRTSWW